MKPKTLYTPSKAERLHCVGMLEVNSDIPEQNLCGFLKESYANFKPDDYIPGQRRKIDEIRQDFNRAQIHCHTFAVSGARRKDLPCSIVLERVKARLGQR